MSWRRRILMWGTLRIRMLRLRLQSSHSNRRLRRSLRLRASLCRSRQWRGRRGLREPRLVSKGGRQVATNLSRYAPTSFFLLFQDFGEETVPGVDAWDCAEGRAAGE